MLKLFLLITSVFIIFSDDQPKKVIEENRLKYAPDKRVEIFDIKYEIINDTLILSGETTTLEGKKSLLNDFKKKGYIVMDYIKTLPDENLADNVYGIVNISVANMRSEPKHSAELSTQVLLGNPLRVLKREKGFYQVQSPDGYISFLDPDGFVRANKETIINWIESDKIIITNKFIFVFDEKGNPVSDLVFGNILKVDEVNQNHFKVEFPDGRTALVKKDDATMFDNWKKNVLATEEKIVNTAKEFMGLPYLWGGTSVKGIDCSGFTKTVFAMNGIILPRDASQQVNTGILVNTSENFDELRMGDLLFFGDRKTENQKERITHVAIYIGNMEFIHSSGMVLINSLDSAKENYSEYRFNTFIRAKRIISSIDLNGITTFSTNEFYNVGYYESK